ncbi:MAG: hypothetical protein AAF146_13185, partial [Bacteroidota bacterium]
MKKTKLKMSSSVLILWIMAASHVTASPPASLNAPSDRPSKAYVEEILTTHNWTLREIVQTKNDTAVNLTLFMLPREKDNILDYAVGGTYQISEGEQQCDGSTESIKGTGTWEFDNSGKVIIDSYNGGRAISKQILELSPEMLKVEYEGEGSKITTLTYFSELSLEDNGMNTLVEDNSNHSQNIAQIPREIMLKSRRYIVVGLDDFKAGIKQEMDDKGGLLKKIVIYPFIDLTDPNTTVPVEERNISLMEQAKDIDIDYIVTGRVIKADADQNKMGEPCGHIKYDVSVLDVNAGEEMRHKSFEFSKLEQEKKEEKSSKVLGKIVTIVGAGLLNTWSYGNWDNYYSRYFSARENQLATDNLNAIFSSGNDSERVLHYKSSIAVMEAIDQTTQDLNKFILEYIPLSIPV